MLQTRCIISSRSVYLRQCCASSTASASSSLITSKPKDIMSEIRQKPSFSKHATVFGGGGFLGHHVVKQLCNEGYQVVVPYRGDPFYYKTVKYRGDVNQVLFMPFHLSDPESLRKAIRNSTVVVNLLGKFSETYKVSFQELNVNGAKRIAQLSRELGVKTFVHVSALNCSNELKPGNWIEKGSQFLRTKALGEEAVRSEFREAIIFRPTLMWGQQDHFIFSFLNYRRQNNIWRTRLRIPLWEKGATTVKQPVFVEDVAKGILQAIRSAPLHTAATFQAVGPHRYRLDDLVRWIFLHLRLRYKHFQIIEPNAYFKLRTYLNQFVHNDYPPVCMEQLEFESHTDQVDSLLPTLEDLNVRLIQMEDRLSWELKPNRRFGWYWDTMGEFPEPVNPPLAS